MSKPLISVSKLVKARKPSKSNQTLRGEDQKGRTTPTLRSSEPPARPSKARPNKSPGEVPATCGLGAASRLFCAALRRVIVRCFPPVPGKNENETDRRMERSDQLVKKAFFQTWRE